MAQITITPDAAKRLAELKNLRGEVADVGVYVERPFTGVYSSDSYHIYAREGGRDSGFSVEIPYGFKFLMERGVGLLPALYERRTGSH